MHGKICLIHNLNREEFIDLIINNLFGAKYILKTSQNLFLRGCPIHKLYYAARSLSQFVAKLKKVLSKEYYLKN